MIDYSVVVPVYRGEATLEKLFLQVKKSMDDLGKRAEVIFVHDNGPDNSWTVICQLKTRYPELVTGIQLTRNFGQHNATICGFKYARGEFVITLDEDLQHSPEDIDLLIAEQKRIDADVIYGVYDDRKHNPLRNITSIALKKILSTGIPDLHRDYTSYRLIKKSIAIETLTMQNSYTFLDGYLSWLTNKVGSVIVTHSTGEAGKSSYTIKKLIAHALNIFITFSTLPIRILSWMSAGIIILSVLFSAYLLARKIFYNDLIPGYTSIIIVLGLGFGLIFFGMAILGEYLQRINIKTTKRPVFLERNIL